MVRASNSRACRWSGRTEQHGRDSSTQGRCCFFFFQAEDGIRDLTVTGVQTCALPILRRHLNDGGTVAYAGDGFPDTEPAQLVPAHLRFARGDLAGVLRSEGLPFQAFRSEERRVGKECRSRWSPYH